MNACHTPYTVMSIQNDLDNMSMYSL